jgi:hypothetical protein
MPSSKNKDKSGTRIYRIRAGQKQATAMID